MQSISHSFQNVDIDWTVSTPHIWGALYPLRLAHRSHHRRMPRVLRIHKETEILWAKEREGENIVLIRFGWLRGHIFPLHLTWLTIVNNALLLLVSNGTAGLKNMKQTWIDESKWRRFPLWNELKFFTRMIRWDFAKRTCECIFLCYNIRATTQPPRTKQNRTLSDKHHLKA